MTETVEDFLQMNYDCKENGSKLHCEVGDTEIKVDAQTRDKTFDPDNIDEVIEDLQ